MGTKKKSIPPDKSRRDVELFPNSVCRRTTSKGKDLEKQIKSARQELHDAIQRSGDRPLSRSPEVLRLSRVLDDLIDEMHSKGKKK